MEDVGKADERRVYSTALNLLLNREDIREIRRWGNSVAFMNDEQTPLTELKVSMFGMDQIERLPRFSACLCMTSAPTRPHR